MIFIEFQLGSVENNRIFRLMILSKLNTTNELASCGGERGLIFHEMILKRHGQKNWIEEWPV